MVFSLSELRLILDREKFQTTAATAKEKHFDHRAQGRYRSHANGQATGTYLFAEYGAR